MEEKVYRLRTVLEPFRPLKELPPVERIPILMVVVIPVLYIAQLQSSVYLEGEWISEGFLPFLKSFLWDIVKASGAFLVYALPTMDYNRVALKERFRRRRSAAHAKYQYHCGKLVPAWANDLPCAICEGWESIWWEVDRGLIPRDFNLCEGCAKRLELVGGQAPTLSIVTIGFPFALNASASIVLLFAGALHNWPPIFYTLLGIVVCGSAFVSAVFLAHRRHRLSPRWVHKSGSFLPSIWVVLALVFNPVIPVPLNRSGWQILDLVTAAAFVLTAWVLRDLTAIPLSDKV